MFRRKLSFEMDKDTNSVDPLAPSPQEPILLAGEPLPVLRKPRDPVERELLRQQNDPIALREDPGWIRLAGARAVRQTAPLDLEATRAWLSEAATLEEVDGWVQHRTAILQRAMPETPLWRDQVRWVLEYALLNGPGDPHRIVYISERAITRAVEAHDCLEAAKANRRRSEGRSESIFGTIHWAWLLAWLGQNLPFPSSPED